MPAETDNWIPDTPADPEVSVTSHDPDAHEIEFTSIVLDEYIEIPAAQLANAQHVKLAPGSVLTFEGELAEPATRQLECGCTEVRILGGDPVEMILARRRGEPEKTYHWIPATRCAAHSAHA